jgi:phenylacetate-CoA ligase
VIGPGVANECIETKDGPVLWEDHFYPEIVDPQTGAVLPDGAQGELVFTSLSKQALPVIRYRTRDLTRLLPPTARPMRRIAKILGRCDDMLIVRGVNVFPSAVREVVARFQPRVTGAILIRPRRKGVKQEPPLPVLVEGDAPVGEAIAREIRAALLFTPEVRMVAPQSLPRSDYKVKLLDYSEATA